MPKKVAKSKRRPRRLKVLHTLHVIGSQGNQYVVKVMQGGKARCSCKGFRYRQECRHVLDPEVRELCARYAPARRSYREVKAMARCLQLAIAPYCDYVEIVGSLRRRKQSVKDIDIVFIPGSHSAAQTCSLFRTFGTPQHHGETMGAIVLPSGVHAQLWPVEDAAVLGAALLHYTGPRDYNISLRIRANRRGWHLCQHGLTDRDTGRLIAGRTEDEVLQALDMPWLPPAMREDYRYHQTANLGNRPDPGYR